MAILGIDEVGRGPWAGPLVIGAVILPDDHPDWVSDLTDSKKLTAKKREILSQTILASAPASGLGWVSSAEIDLVGLAGALRLAARRAVKSVQRLHVPFSEIIIDGTINFLADTPLTHHVTILKKADFLIKEVSAASIIAKVARDHYMIELAKTYPQYGFEKHVGYGTALHRAALAQFGPCPEHRFSFKPVATFATDIVSQSSPLTTTTLGRRAETVASNYLIANGHCVIARNYKTKFYEIDIISVKDDKIYFTEVKYRQSPLRGTPLEAITLAKQKQMRFAAEAFLSFHPQFKTLTPALAVAALSGPEFQLTDWFPLV